MPIQNLKVQGFRSLKDIDWTPGQLNVVIGPNASGKSNLLKLLEMIAASAQRKLGNYVHQSGSYNLLSWDGVSESISFEILLKMMDKNSGKYNYKLHFEPHLNSSDIKIKTESLHYTFRSKDNFSCLFDRTTDHGAAFLPKYHLDTKSIQETVPFNESILSIFNPTYSRVKEIVSFKDYISKFSIYPEFKVFGRSQIRQPVITRYDTELLSDGSNLINVLHTLYTSNRRFRDDINTAMGAAFMDDFEEITFSPASDQHIQLRLQWKSLSKSRSSADLSDGTLRFLILLTILAHPDPCPLIAIDEPETGLHFSMFPIIAEFAQEMSNKSQIIFTSHSPEFLNAFRDTLPTTTIVQSVEGQSVFNVVDEEKLKIWIKDYSLGNLYSTHELEALV